MGERARQSSERKVTAPRGNAAAAPGAPFEPLSRCEADVPLCELVAAPNTSAGA